MNDEDYAERINQAEAAAIALHAEVKKLLSYAIEQRQSGDGERKQGFRHDSLRLDKVRYSVQKAVGQFGRID